MKIYEHVTGYQNVRNKKGRAVIQFLEEMISIILKIYGMDQVQKQGMKQYEEGHLQPTGLLTSIW